MASTSPRLLISYELLEPNRTKTDYERLCFALVSIGAVQVQDSAWTLSTDLSVADVLAIVQGNFGSNDRILVCGVRDIVSRNGIKSI